MTFHRLTDSEWWFILPTVILDTQRPSVGAYWLVWGLEVRW